jgi:hypothetical protein
MWHYQKPFIELFKETMDNALGLLKCNVRYEAFIVGIGCEDGSVEVYPDY